MVGALCKINFISRIYECKRGASRIIAVAGLQCVSMKVERPDTIIQLMGSKFGGRRRRNTDN
jgi:hypothetical protein